MAKVAGGSSKARRRSGSPTGRSVKRKSTGTKRTALAAGDSRSNASSTNATYVVCIDAAGHDDLQTRRIYQVLPDASAARSAFVRVIDDSGEDYLYPAGCFVTVDLPKSVRDALQVVA
jgi:archaellum component FlaG (FlaF/FlaG flagellin family)